MESLTRYTSVTCKTIDGTSIAGWLYKVEGPAPSIIMSHGFNCIKEMTLPEVAESFQSLGYNVLLYDARSVGASGGSPENLIDPLLMAEDLSDIYTYIASLPSVDEHQIILWGMSFGAAVSACCAAIDKRPKAVVMVAPMFTYAQSVDTDKLHRLLVKDRTSQLRGNPAYTVVPFTAQGENMIGINSTGGLEAHQLMEAALQRGHSHFRNRIAVQSYRKLAMFRPMEYMDMLTVPVMMMIPESDNISSPDVQRQALARVKCPKRELLVAGKGHLDIVTGEGGQELVMATNEFIRRTLDREFED